ncbi:MAG: histidine phosphatase family protein [Oscillospiraceae bacterium]|nr:histidine phosphatase family protein [Oscillospiraceae bacterium]
MRLLLIRHGESEADILHVHEGRADFELTERGHRQAEAMSAYAAGSYSIDKIYHSTLKRALQTAEHLAAATGAPLIAEDMLREHDNGLLAGLPYDEAAAKYPRRDVPLHTSLYEQESVLAFRYRAEVMLSKLLSENGTDSTIAAVTHGGMADQLFKAFMRLPTDAGYRLFSGDTCIHELLVENGCRMIVRLNFVPHDI